MKTRIDTKKRGGSGEERRMGGKERDKGGRGRKGQIGEKKQKSGGSKRE